MSYIWHPCTQAKTSPSPLKVKSAQGVWLELDNGHRILDCISSWWVNIHGHSHPKIAQAIYEQANHLEHVIFAGFTHDPAEELAEKLLEYLPENLCRVFFSDNGSTAVEVALKMAYQYWMNQNQKRHKFIAFSGAYHGDTIGAMSLGSRSIFSQVFSDLLFQVDYIPFPETYIGDEKIFEKEQESLTLLEQLLAQDPDYAGVVIEPLIQGAGGMRMCRPEFLQQLQKIIHHYKILLIFDEVMTGFGRTGDWFACRKASVNPDIICLSKGLTGGFLPLAVTVCTEAIYHTFYSQDPTHTFYHGHSYTANPLGCAAALASLALLREHASAFQTMEQKHTDRFQRLQGIPNLEKLRITGTIAAMDVITSLDPGYLNQVSLIIREKAIPKGLLLRPLGQVLYLLPPYCITDEELDFVYAGIESILQELHV